MHRRLLVADQIVPDVSSLQVVMDVDGGSTGKPENGIHALLFEDFHQNLRSVEFHGQFLLVI